MNDDDLIERLRGVERDVALDAEAEQRVFDRMLRAHISEVATASHTQQMQETAHVFELHPSDRVRADEQRPAFGRWSAVLARAALIMVVAAGLIGVVLTRTTSDDSTPAVSDTPSSTPATTSASTPAPSTASGPDGLRSVLGFGPFTTYNYVDQREIGDAVTSTPMTIRVGELTDGGVASTRRLLVGADGDDRIIVDLVQAADGTVIVPVELIDPTLFGGVCTGGAIRLSRTAATTDSTATCGGVEDVVLDVSSSLGANERLDLDTGVTVDAVPLSITIQPATGSPARTVTLWFSDDGVVRWSFPTPAGTADYDISPESADRLG